MASKRQVRALAREIEKQGDTQEQYEVAALEFDDTIARICRYHPQEVNDWLSHLTSEEKVAYLIAETDKLLSHHSQQSKPTKRLFDWL